MGSGACDCCCAELARAIARQARGAEELHDQVSFLHFRLEIVEEVSKRIIEAVTDLLEGMGSSPGTPAGFPLDVARPACQMAADPVARPACPMAADPVAGGPQSMRAKAGSGTRARESLAAAAKTFDDFWARPLRTAQPGGPELQGSGAEGPPAGGFGRALAEAIGAVRDLGEELPRGAAEPRPQRGSAAVPWTQLPHHQVDDALSVTWPSRREGRAQAPRDRQHTADRAAVLAVVDGARGEGPSQRLPAASTRPAFDQSLPCAPSTPRPPGAPS